MARISKKTGSYHHGDLRRVLLETAVKVVEKDGVAALSLQALARRAGVSSGAPYHHFTSREGLLAAIAAQGFELLVAEMQREASRSGGCAREQLEALGRGYVLFALAHRGHFRVMFRAELRSQLDEAQAKSAGEAYLLLQRAIERCQAEHVAPPGDPSRLILLAWSSVHGASALWIDGSFHGEPLVKDGAALAATVASTVAELLAIAGADAAP